MADSPGSPLSSHSSSEFTEDGEQYIVPYIDPAMAYAQMPAPRKRQKTSASSYRSTPQYDLQEDGEISSDTSGSAPSSPIGSSTLVQDEEPGEQVTVCRWRNCDGGDLGNMDLLVHHIKDRHIDNHSGRAHKKFVCEWEGCNRIDVPHASAYALRSHMRSHTREKPFYCGLPECDKSFTRSDALAKHMRTVHETEALRPSDPIPRNHSQAQIKPQKLKLTFKKGLNFENGVAADEDVVNGEVETNTKNGFVFPPDLQFTEEEETMHAKYLFSLSRRQRHWSEQEGEKLKQESANLEAGYKEEWQRKELVLLNMMEVELERASVREFGNLAKEDHVKKMMEELLPAEKLPLTGGKVPWYRNTV